MIEFYAHIYTVAHQIILPIMLGFYSLRIYSGICICYKYINDIYTVKIVLQILFPKCLSN